MRRNGALHGDYHRQHDRDSQLHRRLTYSLTVNIDPLDSGNSVTLSNTGPVYHYGDVVILTPVLAAGWQFDHMDGAVCDETGCTVTITGNMVVTAYFTKIEYTLTVNSAHGTVTKTPTQDTYHYNDPVILTMTSVENGWTFGGWSGGGCTGTDPCTVTITGDTTVTATFTQNQYTLGLTIVGQGTVVNDPNQATYTYGQVVNLTPSGETGWSFTGWGGDCSGNGDCQVTMDSNKAVTATFTEDLYNLDITKIGEGTVDPDGAGPYPYGAEVILTADPADGWSVSEWSVEGCTGETCTVTMFGDLSVIVTFTQDIRYTLTVTSDPVDGGTVSKDPDDTGYLEGTVVSLTAYAADGWEFDSWTGDCAGQGNPCILTMDNDKTATAVFAQTISLPKDLIVNPGTVVEGFESMSGWTISGSGTGFGATLDTSNFKEGVASIMLTTPASGNVTITKPVTWDLSANQGNFRLWVYVSGSSEPTGGRIILSNDASFSNYWTASYGGAFKLRYKPGWNLINLRTSDWKVGKGSPNWTNIVRIRIRLDSQAVNTYSFDALTSGVVAQPAVLFTFDKGLSSLYDQAFAYMQSRNVRGTGYVVTDWADTTGYASWAQLQAMDDVGWTIGNQTTDYTVLTTLPDVEAQKAKLADARAALVANGIVSGGNYVAYPAGNYDNDTLLAMANLGMRNGRTLLAFNNLSPLANPYQIAQRSISKSTSLATAQGWVNTAIARQEILVIKLEGLSASPASTDWYIARFKSLIDYCIAQGIPIITMDDLYKLQSSDITIPGAR